MADQAIEILAPLANTSEDTVETAALRLLAMEQAGWPPADIASATPPRFAPLPQA